MPYHIFGNEDRSMDFSVMNTEGVSDEFRSDCTGPGPCFDNSFLSRLIKPFYFLYKASVYIWSFFKTTCHSIDGLNEVKCVPM